VHWTCLKNGISGNLPARVAVWAEELTENPTLQVLVREAGL
jgi:hypothetical protein